MRGNFFVGYNLGNNVYKIGILCLIGIAHLPEKLADLSFQEQLEIRPCLSTNISKDLNRDLLDLVPNEGKPIFLNLVHSLKLITAKILPNIPVCGNVNFEDIWDEIDDIMSADEFNDILSTNKGERDIEIEMREIEDSQQLAS